MGISGAINHDAAVATVHDGEILFAGHSERYSKKKNDPELHQQLINDAIKYYVSIRKFIRWHVRVKLLD